MSEHRFSSAPQIRSNRANRWKTCSDHGWGQNTEAIATHQALDDKLTDAFEREDISLLRQLLSDDHAHNNVFGSRLTKDEFLKDIDIRIDPFDG